MVLSPSGPVTARAIRMVSHRARQGGLQGDQLGMPGLCAP